MNNKLWYETPATSFTEALPVGNGCLGGMIYGGVPAEKISVNLDTFWSGTCRKQEKNIPSEYLEMARKLIFDGKCFEAEQFIKENMLGEFNESYMPLCNVFYTFSDIDTYDFYKRELDLEVGIHTVTFYANGRKYKIETFVSHIDKTMSVNIECDTINGISVEIAVDSKVEHTTTINGTNEIIIYGNAPSTVAPNYVDSKNPIVYDRLNPGMAFAGVLSVNHNGGNITHKDNRLVINKATSVNFLFSASTGFREFNQKIITDAKECINICHNIINNLSNKRYAQIREAHTDDFSNLYRRCEFVINKTGDEAPTDKRLQNFKEGKSDDGLYSLFFNFNKYLMIASSRQGSQPANLQGIWNESIRPAWSSNWTININTQMNYWSTLQCNLADCYYPLIKMVEELSVAGKETAKKQFHSRGWAANHNVDIWRHTAPVGGEPKYAYFPFGGAWLAAQICDYYYYTKDEDYTKKTIFPILEGAVQFCLDWIVLGKDNLYHTAPSTSPENTYIDDKGRECGVSESSAFDIAIIYELLSQYIELDKELRNSENELCYKAKEVISHLPKKKVAIDGRLQEWMFEYKDADKGHRHLSPMVGLHPFDNITDEKIISACRELLEIRIKNGKKQIGWSCAWYISIWAKLQESEKAKFYLDKMIRESLYNNLFDLHPPLGENEGEKEVFQIDGNFGANSGIINMLMESKKGMIKILPALPKEWSNGHFKGLLAMGNILVDLYWCNRRIKNICLVSPYRQTVRISSPLLDNDYDVELESNILKTIHDIV